MKKTTLFPLITALLYLAVLPLHAQYEYDPARRWSGEWRETTTSNAPDLMHPDMTYDSLNNRLVLAGKDFYEPGWPPSNIVVYTYDSNRVWHAGPHPLGALTPGDVELAYDSHRDRTVMYTGHETWELTGENWALRDTETDPVNCDDGAVFTYDPLGRRCVLVANDNPWGTSATETWTYNGSNWTQHVGMSPSNGVFGSMCYDTARAETVLLTRNAMETYTYDAVSWSNRMPAACPTPPCGFNDLAYDPSNQLAVVFGGEGGENPLYWVSCGHLGLGRHWLESSLHARKPAAHPRLRDVLLPAP